MVLKRLKLLKFLMVCGTNFSYTQAYGCWKRGRNLKISAKKSLLVISSAKNQISPVLAPRRKTLGKIHQWAPLEEFLLTPVYTSMQNDTIFVKNCVVLHHLATLFNNTNAVSNPWQGNRLCTVYSANYEILQNSLPNYK